MQINRPDQTFHIVFLKTTSLSKRPDCLVNFPLDSLMLSEFTLVDTPSIQDISNELIRILFVSVESEPLTMMNDAPHYFFSCLLGFSH